MLADLLAPVNDKDCENQSDLQKLMNAVTFASVKHKDQRRKDVDSTPYINHTLGVAQILSSAGIDDLYTLQSAILHDTVEDTNTTFEELQKFFGEKVASIVKECTDNKSLPKATRKQAQIDHASKVSLEAQRIKLADKLYNLRDLIRAAPPNWTINRITDYFVWSHKVTSQISEASLTISKDLHSIYESAYFERNGQKYKCHPHIY